MQLPFTMPVLCIEQTTLQNIPKYLHFLEQAYCKFDRNLEFRSMEACFLKKTAAVVATP